jgi:hypothetical protein
MDIAKIMGVAVDQFADMAYVNMPGLTALFLVLNITALILAAADYWRSHHRVHSCPVCRHERDHTHAAQLAQRPGCPDSTVMSGRCQHPLNRLQTCLL